MKKLLSGILVLTLCFGIVGCSGDSKPDDMTQETYDAGLRVLEVVDRYLDGKIEADQAQDDISSLADRISGDGMGDFTIEQCTKRLELSFYMSDVDVQDHRDELAEALGE